jgi:hypothetical protein
MRSDYSTLDTSTQERAPQCVPTAEQHPARDQARRDTGGPDGATRLARPERERERLRALVEGRDPAVIRGCLKPSPHDGRGLKIGPLFDGHGWA